ncbi:lipoprotein [Crenothrix sp.]
MPQKLLFVSLILTLTSCGQPGPLYLPTKPEPVLVKPAPEPKELKKD